MNKFPDIREHEELRQLVLKNEDLAKDVCDEFVKKNANPDLMFRRGVVVGSAAMNQGCNLARVETERGFYYFILQDDRGTKMGTFTLDWWLHVLRREDEKTASKSEPEARTE